MKSSSNRAQVLVSYAQPSTLSARVGLYAYRRDRSDLRAAIAALVDVRPGARVLDIGCGETPYFAAWVTREPAVMIGLDASWEMLERARCSSSGTASIALVRGLLDALPFKPRAWDVVLAAHSLYHADEPARVLARLPTLLRSDGGLYVVLNGRDHLREIRSLALEAGHPGLLRESARLDAEDAIDILESQHHVTTRWFEDELDIPTADPIIAYVDSTRAIYEPLLPGTLTWDAMLDHLARLVDLQITSAGTLRVRARSALIRCE